MKDNEPRWVKSDHVFVERGPAPRPYDPKVVELVRRRELELLRRLGKR